MERAAGEPRLHRGMNSGSKIYSESTRFALADYDQVSTAGSEMGSLSLLVRRACP